MIAHVDGDPKVDRHGDSLLLTFPSGGDQVQLMLSLNGSLHLRRGLIRGLDEIFGEQQGASITEFPKRRRRT